MIQPARVPSEGNHRDGRQKAYYGQARNQIQNRASRVGSKCGLMTPDNPHRIKPKHSQRGKRVGRRKRNEFDADECLNQERKDDGGINSPAQRDPEGQSTKGQWDKDKDAEQIRTEQGDLLPKEKHRGSAKSRGNVKERIAADHRCNFFAKNAGCRRKQRKEDNSELVCSEPICDSLHFNPPPPPGESPAAFPAGASAISNPGHWRRRIWHWADRRGLLKIDRQSRQPLRPAQAT